LGAIRQTPLMALALDKASGAGVVMAILRKG
jgi:hypothetical protein